MREDIIEALESTRGYIDGCIADLRRANKTEDALFFITSARRLRYKAQDVLDEAVRHAALEADASWEDIAPRCGVPVEEVQKRYPQIVKALEQREKDRIAFFGDDPQF